jgi:hypothetical protein
MGNYAGSRVVSVRIEPELLEAVRHRAKVEGRSVSGQIVLIVREQVQAEPKTKQKQKPITGWLRHLAVPESDDAMRAGRAEVTKKLMRAVRRKARRK